MRRPTVFSIASDLSFLDALAAGVSAETSEDPLALAGYTILLPTRRAVRALREAFLRGSGGRPLLLPRLMPVGDLDADEFAFVADDSDEAFGGLDIPPAVPELRRQLLLTRLVLGWGRAHGIGPSTPGQAAPLARELARFLDEVQTEGLDLARLATLVPAKYAEHWQQTLIFLDILTENWPRLLAEIGCLDPAERRNRVLAAQAAAWQREPPRTPIVAAGLTGGIAAVADLLAVVATLPHGAVVLSGIDVDAGGWDKIAADPAHPQHLHARLLARLEIEPADIRPWPVRPAADQSGARRRLVREALRPAAESDRWRDFGEADASMLDGIMRLDCAGPQDEATVIALLLRQCLEHPGETAALVTPDRSLARRVAAELRRWDIEIDDSAGTPLNKTPPGVFLRLVLELATENLAPLPLLAALKHPLAAGGTAPGTFRASVRRLEMAMLRGPRPAPGFAGLRATIRGGDADLALLIDGLEAALAPLMSALASRNSSIAAMVAAHVAAAEALAASDEENGAARLWREDAGEAAAEFLDQLLQAAASLSPLDGADYPPLFEALLAGPVVRPRFGRHPRLAIWGLLEARLQRADLMILGGLNEGTWPPQVESDPWLSRPMRHDFGLPPPERRIGIAAHDFAQALGAPRVALTRATRVEGAPTVPSRWLLRIDTVLRAAGLEGKLGLRNEALAWQEHLDEADRLKPLAPPEPRPPVAARPRRLSVTQIETWMRDPYAIYAREILRLRALDPIDADPGAAERGQFIHAALDAFLRAFPDRLPGDAEAELLRFGKEAFGAALERPGVRAFWWPRFERIARWFVAHDAQRRTELVETMSEVGGRLALDGPAGGFLLTAQADRIDRRRDGGAVLVDYKTGAVPSASDISLGYSPQLPLEAAIAERGGFAGIAPAAIATLEYWRLTGGDPPGIVVPPGKDEADVRRLIDEALQGLNALIVRFDDRQTPYRAVPRPDKAPRYSDYAQLSRVKEWSVTGEGGE